MKDNFRNNFYDAKQLLEDVRREIIPLASADPILKSAWEFLFSAIGCLEDWEINLTAYDMVCIGIDQCRYAEDCLDQYTAGEGAGQKGLQRLKDKIAEAIEKLEAEYKDPCNGGKDK